MTRFCVAVYGPLAERPNEDESDIVEAIDEEDAAATWGESNDRDTADFGILDGDKPTVAVRECGSSGPWKLYRVSARLVPEYEAEEVCQLTVQEASEALAIAVDDMLANIVWTLDREGRSVLKCPESARNVVDGALNDYRSSVVASTDRQERASAELEAVMIRKRLEGL